MPLIVTVGKNMLDVALVTFLVYIAIALLRRTRSVLIFRGFLGLFFVYLVASFAGLALTTLIFRFLFSFFVVIVVLVFQREFRRFFEELALLFSAPFARNRESLTSDVRHMILRSLQYLSKKKIGALIVLAGRQPLERFIDGGFDLYGRLSEPLLLSIFDPSSPGHDGALIVDNNTVVKFGAHLPLSDEAPRGMQTGTRHRSAIGLSERSDAFVIVVSEERGTISYARDGKLTTVAKPAELEPEILEFYRETFPQEDGMASSAFNAFTQNWEDKLLALFLSFLLWFLFIFR